MSIIYAYGSMGINSNLNDKSWDELYGKVLKELDENKRIEMTRQLMNQGYNHYSIIVTVNVKALYAVSNKVGEWRAHATGLGATYEGMQRK